MSRSPVRRLVRWLLVAAIAWALLVGAIVFGTPPPEVGLVAGRLRSCPPTPNCVSSRAPEESEAAIAPLPSSPGLHALARIVAGSPGARIETLAPDYLHAVYRTRWLRFSDDLELHQPDPAGPVHVRSASRLGYSDLGKNRARVEALRARVVAAGEG